MDTLLSELGGPLERSAVDAGATDVVEPPTIAMDDQGHRHPGNVNSGATATRQE
jgi:hypothetical protein